jgi:methionyl aminopeptidase
LIDVRKAERITEMFLIGRNDPCWCGSGKKYKQCHLAFDEKLKQFKREGYIVPKKKIIKTPEQIAAIKESAKINIAVLDYVAEHIKEGVSTEDINTWVHEETIRQGATPATLGYQGYPKSVCTSVNDEVCHGIPDANIILKDGDIINVDCSTIYNGYFSDSSRMFCIGNVSDEKKKLVEDVKKSIELGLEQVKPWTTIGNIGQAINDFATEQGYSVVREIGGHGVGLEFHEDPWVGYVTKRDTGMLMVPGMMFTIEPMINMGRPEIYQDADNGWTIYTEDGSPSAQWEVQVLVTEDGYEIISY